MVAPFSFIFFAYIANLILNHACTYSTYVKFVTAMILVELLLIQGYFVRIGTSEVSYQLFGNCILLIYSMVFIVKNRIKVTYTDFIYSFLFLIAALIGVIHQSLVPYDGLVMTYDSQGSWDAYTLGANNKGFPVISWARVLSIYVTFITATFTIFIFHSCLQKETIRTILATVNKILRWNVYFVSFEFVFKNIVHSDLLLRLEVLFLGEGTNTYSTLIIRNGLYQLQGLTREPSHLALTLFFTIVLYIIGRMLDDKHFMKSNYLYIAYIMVLMIVSGSFASYLYIMVVICWGIYLLMKKSHSGFKYIISFFSLSIMVLLAYLIINGGLDSSTYLGRRINLATELAGAVISNSWYGMGGDSALPRFLSLYDTFSDFLERPLFGMGLSVQISHGGLVNVLSDIGIVGLFFWTRLVFNKFTYYYPSILFLLLGSNLLLGNVFETLGLTYVIFIIACLRKNNFEP